MARLSDPPGHIFKLACDKRVLPAYEFIAEPDFSRIVKLAIEIAVVSSALRLLSLN
jgi:hypothetical protein